MFFKRMRARGVVLAAVPVLALGLVGAGALTVAHADEPQAGQVGVSRLSQARHDLYGKSKARRAVRPMAAPSVLGDWNGDGKADIMGRDATGKLWLYPGTGQGATPYHARRLIGGGWNAYNSLVRHGDWNVDGKQDILARDSQGALWYYKATGAATGSGHYARTRIGGGWQIYRHLVGVDDWTADGLDDLIAVDTAGKLWLYAGKGTGLNFFQPRKQIGTGWQVYDILTADGDLTYDNAAELTARDRNGYVWAYNSTGDPVRPYGPRFELDPGNTYRHLNAIVGVGDLNGGGQPDLLVRDRAGRLFASLSEEPAFDEPVGRGWNIYNFLF